MEYVIAIALAIGLAIFLASLGDDKKKVIEGMPAKLVIQKKTCPPHQWFWQEIVDQDGTRQGERIVCKVCGPLRLNGEPPDEV